MLTLSAIEPCLADMNAADRPRVPVSTLTTRLEARIDRRGPLECWPWTAARSRSGRREVDYGVIWNGSTTQKLWRANRLVLMLKTGPVDVPIDDGESFDDWLLRLARFYRGLEASHVCDVSLCCNPDHLEWKEHRANVTEQKARQRLAAQRVARELSELSNGSDGELCA